MVRAQLPVAQFERRPPAGNMARQWGGDLSPGSAATWPRTLKVISTFAETFRRLISIANGEVIAILGACVRLLSR